MLPLTYPQNVDGASFDKNEPISSNMRRTSYILLLSILFRSDLPLSGPSSLFNRLDSPPFNFEKIDKEPVGEFL